MFARECVGQKAGYWHNDVFAKMETRLSRMISRDLQYLRRFSVCFPYKSFSIPISFENFETQTHNEISKKLSFQKSKQDDVRSENW